MGFSGAEVIPLSHFPARANLPDILQLSLAKCEDEEPAIKALMII